jgi:lipoprotein-releasing system permease protein
VASVLPFYETRCLAARPGGRPQALALRALPLDAGSRDPGLLPALGLAGPLFPAGGGLVLGDELARYIDVRAGEEVELLLVAAGAEGGIRAETVRIRVARTFRSGYLEYDFGLAFISFEEAAAIFGADSPTSYVYGVKLRDRFSDGPFAARLEAEYGLGPERVQGWRDYNRAFFGALRTEKTMMMILIGLIFLVVGVNIYHAMRSAVASRMEDIALLKAVGASSASIGRAFVLDGLAVGAGGAFIGLVLGLLIAVNVNEVFALAEMVARGIALVMDRLLGTKGDADFRVFSPRLFYLTEVPVRVLFPEAVFVVTAAILSAAAAAAAAAARVSKMAPAEVLRYE